MQKPGVGFTFLLITASAAIACGLGWTRLASLEDAARTAERSKHTWAQVVVPVQDLRVGVTIEEKHLAIRQLPVDYLPAEPVLQELEKAVGRVPRERILANEPIRVERLADPEAGTGRDAVTPRGMRALAVQIDNGSASDGFVTPGSYVDALVTPHANADHVIADTVTVLQAVPVLDVTPTDSGQTTLTLALSPDDIARLTQALTTGTLALSLRNPIDVTHVETHGGLSNVRLGGIVPTTQLSVIEWKKRRR